MTSWIQLFQKNKLVIAIDAYSNRYDGFLGQVQVYVPKEETVGSDAAVLAMIDNSQWRNESLYADYR